MHLPRIFPRFLLAALLLSSPAGAGEVLLEREDLVAIRPTVWAAEGLELPDPDPDLPIVGAASRSDGARLLRIYNGRGGINGFRGIIYDNRDRGHSTLDPELYPRLARLKYGKELETDGLDFGLAGRIFLPAVVLGNSSTALERGAAPRSLTRLAMTNAFWRAVSPILYANNHIYVYPEHRDYDAEDRFPLNWPYMITSQGSSRSDLKFLNAIALTLAAFPRDTFVAMRDNGLVAPTVQMILRRNLAPVATREDYLSGIAHPPVFNGKLIRAGRMVEQAANMRPEQVPPMVRLQVVEDDFAQAAGLGRLDERILDTPAAIGRLWRGFEWAHEMVVTTEGTSAPGGGALTYEWRVLRGDPERVRIEPQGETGGTARIRIFWQDPWMEAAALEGGPERRVSRVDIGVFASNGDQDSAPSFISVDFPAHQLRRYGAGPDGEMRLESIDYDARGRGAYYDPLIYWTAAWSDTARYDADGRREGWLRRSAEGTGEDVVPEGAEAPVYEIRKGGRLVAVGADGAE